MFCNGLIGNGVPAGCCPQVVARAVLSESKSQFKKSKRYKLAALPARYIHTSHSQVMVKVRDSWHDGFVTDVTVYPWVPGREIILTFPTYQRLVNC